MQRCSRARKAARSSHKRRGLSVFVLTPDIMSVEWENSEEAQQLYSCMRLVVEQVGEGPHFRVDGSDLITRPQWAPVPYAPTSSVIVHAETDTSHALRQEMDHLSPVDITQADIPETWRKSKLIVLFKKGERQLPNSHTTAYQGGKAQR